MDLSMTTNWKEAAELALATYLGESLCFTSGHVCKAVRLARPDYVFKQVGPDPDRHLGAFVRSQFYGGRFGAYVQVERELPDGRTVFVYGPDQAGAESFDFELTDIPTFSPKAAPAVGTTPAQAPATSATVPIVPSAPAPAPADKASVYPDGRICVPGPVMRQIGVEPGDNYFISVPGDGTVVLTRMDPGPTKHAVRYADQFAGRAVFVPPGGISVTHGQEIDLEVAGDRVIVKA